MSVAEFFFWKERVTCPCRNEGSSFVLVVGGKEVPKLCFGLLFLDFQVIDIPALVMRFFMWLLRSCVNVKPRRFGL